MFLGNDTPSGFSGNPVSANLKNKWLTASFRPLLGYTQYVNGNAAFYNAQSGAGLSAYLGKHFAIAAEITQTWQDQILSTPEYFTLNPGRKWTYWSNGGGVCTEWTGQFTWSWKWGSLGVFNDRFEWGNASHGSQVFSALAPAVPFIRLHLRPAHWIEFSYIHAWLRNNIIDFTAVNKSDQYAFASSINKHIAANMLTATPWKGLDISLGNSIVYDGPVQLAYLIPVLFYKSVDHTLSTAIDNENSQFFIDISSRQIRHLHLYLSLFVDEFKISRVGNPDEHNFLSWKAGTTLSNFPFKNLSLTIEGTRTLPSTFQHYVPTLTYASDGYGLGSYLRDNSQEIFIAMQYRPVHRLGITLSFNLARHGDEFQYGLVENPVTLPVLKNISWQNRSVAMNVSWSLLSGTYVFVNYQLRETQGDIKYTPAVYTGKTDTFSAGIQTGF